MACNKDIVEMYYNDIKLKQGTRGMQYTTNKESKWGTFAMRL